MNNQMDDFSIQPGVPNAYGLVGSEANRVQPGKRPLSSMSPTLVLKDGKPLLTTGAAGGPTIITQVVQSLVNIIDRGMPVREALAAPRVHHQWRPPGGLYRTCAAGAGAGLSGRARPPGVQPQVRGYLPADTLAGGGVRGGHRAATGGAQSRGGGQR